MTECESCEEYDSISSRQQQILRQVANALNGPPRPLSNWSHHDLGVKAERLVVTQHALIAQLRAGITLLGAQDITPAGARVLERILDEAEAKLPPTAQHQP